MMAIYDLISEKERRGLVPVLLHKRVGQVIYPVFTKNRVDI